MRHKFSRAASQGIDWSLPSIIPWSGSFDGYFEYNLNNPGVTESTDQGNSLRQRARDARTGVVIENGQQIVYDNTVFLIAPGRSYNIAGQIRPARNNGAHPLWLYVEVFASPNLNGFGDTTEVVSVVVDNTNDQAAETFFDESWVMPNGTKSIRVRYRFRLDDQNDLHGITWENTVIQLES
jgi:hypothetical protein